MAAQWLSRPEPTSLAGQQICDTYMQQRAASALLQLFLFHLSFNPFAQVCHGTQYHLSAICEV